MNGKRPFDTHIIVLHVQMNEFPEGHVKVPSWELFILHIAKSSWLARGLLSGNAFSARIQNVKPKEIES